MTRRPETVTSSAPGEVRAFVALDIDDEALTRIADLIAALRPRNPGLRLVGAAGIHLTLRFLGPSRPEAIELMRPALALAAARCPAGAARIAGLGLFPERGAPRVLWLGLDLPPETRELQAACEAAAVAAGYSREARPFRPHLTLGRWRERAPRPTLPPVELGVARLDRLVLYRSELRPAGAVYTPLAGFPLGPHE